MNTRKQATNRDLRAELLKKIAAAACAIVLGGWNENQVGIDVPEISHWGTGSVYDPILVTRDNPWSVGWFSWPAGKSSVVDDFDTYSSVFQWTGLLGYAFTYEYNSAGDWIADWVTPIRPIPGTWSSPTFPYANVSVKYGSLVPDNIYAMTKCHMFMNPTDGPHWAPSATHVKLADDIIVVPVIIMSFIQSAPSAGPAEYQDFRARGLTMFDYITFNNSFSTNAVDNWSIPSWMNPTQDMLPPDDIWAQCGIQFQVVRTFKWPSQNPAGVDACDSYPTYRNFASDGWVRAQIESELGASEAADIDELDPIWFQYGSLDCGDWAGHTHQAEGVCMIVTRQV